MAVAHFQKAMYQEALQDSEMGLALTHRDPFFLSVAALVHGRLGQMPQAEKLVEEMRADRKRRLVAPYFFATALVGMNKQQEAMDALEEGYKARDAYMVGLNSTPWFGPLRSAPRFQELLHRMNLPGGE
jgi:predicted Zn-dependent protease